MTYTVNSVPLSLSGFFTKTSPTFMSSFNFFDFDLIQELYKTPCMYIDLFYWIFMRKANGEAPVSVGVWVSLSAPVCFFFKKCSPMTFSRVVLIHLNSSHVFSASRR